MEIMGKMKETITYKSKDCEHNSLVKLAPMWYACKTCGRVFNVPFSLQFTYEEAMRYLSKIVVGIKEREKLIKAGERRTSLKEKKEERRAIEDYKRNRVSKKSEPRGN